MPVRLLRVLICGAGIAGATLACLLGRQGHRVTVVERDAGVRSSGNPVDVRGDAFPVVDALGLVPDLTERATSVRRLVLVDAGGRAIGSIPTRRSAQHELEIPRADLCEVLVRAARQEADVRFGDGIVDLRERDGGADVTFSSDPPGGYDLVVGADGIHSTTRRLAFGPDSGYITSFGMYLATVMLPSPLGRDDTVLLYNEPGTATALHPGRGTPGAGFFFRSAAAIDPRDGDAATDLLQRAYAGAGWRVPELLAHYLGSSDTYFDVVSRVRVPRWSRGRVVLLGDAASSVSVFGEGSSSAIAGAATLARSLGVAARSVPDALGEYERKHRRASERGQRTASPVSHLLVPATARGLALRDLALRVTAPRPPRPPRA